MSATSTDSSSDTASSGELKARALVLAAARPDDPLAMAEGVRHKCLLQVGGQPMLRRVVRALHDALEISEVFIIIDDETAARQALGDLADVVAFLPVAELAAASTAQALEQLFAQSPAPVLVTTGDHALLTSDMVAAMFAAARKHPRADLLVGLAQAEVVQATFPEVRRTWLRFGRDRVTACNLFLFADARAIEAARFWRRVERERKKPWRIARAFGLWPLLRVLLGLASLPEAFALASRKLGVAATPVLLNDARAAIDVDKPSDLRLARHIAAMTEG